MASSQLPIKFTELLKVCETLQSHTTQHLPFQIDR